MRITSLSVFVVALLAACPAMSQTAPAPVPAALRRVDVEMPRAWPDVVEALITAHRQAGLRYAVVPARFKGVIGPYAPGQKVNLGRLVGAVAAATGTTAHTVGNVVVLDPKGESAVKAGADPRRDVYRLALNGRSGTIGRLSQLVAHDDSSVRFQALAALCQRIQDGLCR